VIPEGMEVQGSFGVDANSQVVVHGLFHPLQNKQSMLRKDTTESQRGTTACSMRAAPIVQGQSWPRGGGAGTLGGSGSLLPKLLMRRRVVRGLAGGGVLSITTHHLPCTRVIFPAKVTFEQALGDKRGRVMVKGEGGGGFSHR